MAATPPEGPHEAGVLCFHEGNHCATEGGGLKEESLYKDGGSKAHHTGVPSVHVRSGHSRLTSSALVLHQSVYETVY